MPNGEDSKGQEPILDISKLPTREARGGAYRGYANIVSTDWTLTDVQLRFFALMYGPNPDSPIYSNQSGIIEERASMTIPWHQAKVLRDMLADAVAAYESANGELRPLKLPGSK